MKTKNLYFTNRKEYYRRKAISLGLKRYYEIKSKEEVVEKEEKPKRTRQQIVYNSDYAISLRAIGFNNKYSEDKLDWALFEFLFSNKQLQRINFDVEGFENEEIDNFEDRNLNQNKITIEYNQRGHTTYTEY